MAVQFVLGRAGTGKTHRCLTSIADAMRADPLGRPIYWIVPKQATFMAERMLTSEVGSFCRTRVLSFEQLAREVFAYAGGNVIPEVTPAGRQMVIGHLLRQLRSQLQFFSSSAGQPGLAVELDATFGEFERSGQSLEALSLFATDLEASTPADVGQQSLLAKMRDLLLIYRAYMNFLGQDRLDPHQRMRQVLRCLEQCPTLRGAAIYVDGFSEFNDFERRLLAEMGLICERVEIMLLLDPESQIIHNRHYLPAKDDLFSRTEQTYRRLHFALTEKGVEIAPPIALPTPRRFQVADLASIEATLFSEAPGPAIQPDSIELVTAPTRRAEVDAVARRIRALWREGVRFRDIAVLMRDVEPYTVAIDTSFREHGIAYFIDRRRSAAHHPLIQFVRGFFQIVRHDWPEEAVLAVLKSGLSGLSSPDVDAVENYARDHNIQGFGWEQPESWAYRKRIPRDQDVTATQVECTKIDAVRRTLVDRFQPSLSLLRASDGRRVRVRECARELFAVLDRFKVSQTLAAWSEQARPTDPEQAAEHEQVWAEFVALADQLVDVLGEEEMPLADFVTVLFSGLEQFDLAITPPTVDQVLVGSIDRTRCPELHTAFVLGLNEGEFPRVSREPSILTDPDRRAMRQRNIELDPDRRSRLHEEDLLGYIAFTRPSSRLIVSRSRATESGRATSPSRFWELLRSRVPGVDVLELLPSATDDPALLETPRQVLIGLMRWVRSSPTPADETGVWPAVYQWFAHSDNIDDRVTCIRDLGWRALSYTNNAALSAELAKDLLGEPLRSTARELETFAACPFRHFIDRGLRLTGSSAGGVSAIDLSNVYHRVLDSAFGSAITKRIDWLQLKETLTPAVISRHAAAVGKKLQGELMLGSARNQYILGRIERTLSDVVSTQEEMMRRGGFRPHSTGVVFGSENELSPLSINTPQGKKVELRGSIDRIDLLSDGEHAAVFDYKLAAGPLSLQDVYHGLSLQLLTYLLLVQSSGEELTGKPLTPVAAFYLPVLRRLNDVKHPDDALDPADPNFHLRIKPRGVFDAAFLPALDAGLSLGASDVVAAHVKKDGELGFRDKSDALDSADFAALVNFVERRIGELADQILEGEVAVRPYKLGQATPCPTCSYRSICRFEPAINRYNTLNPMRREDVLVTLREGAADGE